MSSSFWKKNSVQQLTNYNLCWGLYWKSIYLCKFRGTCKWTSKHLHLLWSKAIWDHFILQRYLTLYNFSHIRNSVPCIKSYILCSSWRRSIIRLRFLPTLTTCNRIGCNIYLFVLRYCPFPCMTKDVTVPGLEIKFLSWFVGIFYLALYVK